MRYVKQLKIHKQLKVKLLIQGYYENNPARIMLLISMFSYVKLNQHWSMNFPCLINFLRGALRFIIFPMFIHMDKISWCIHYVTHECAIAFDELHLPKGEISMDVRHIGGKVNLSSAYKRITCIYRWWRWRACICVLCRTNLSPLCNEKTLTLLGLLVYVWKIWWMKENLSRSEPLDATACEGVSCGSEVLPPYEQC